MKATTANQRGSTFTFALARTKFRTKLEREGNRERSEAGGGPASAKSLLSDDKMSSSGSEYVLCLFPIGSRSF